MPVFEDIKPGARLRGLDPAGIAEVVQVARFGPDALNLVFRVNGRVGERLVYRGEEGGFDFLDAGRTYAFDADGGLLRLASEAYRIRLAYLFDPYLAVSASQIEALPHQITAVYGEMLPRQPLRFLLADDPGAGKTIMAGLLIKELLIRGDLERCLIVAPGSLVEQWQDELSEKFALNFDILTRDQIEASVTGNPFLEKTRLILRLDMAARSDELKAKLQAAPDWDLVICDEAHRMAASYFGGEVKETHRHKFGKLLGTRTRNFLLMSATPHNGKEADFQLFMGLLDADRFEGRFREGVHKADVSDMMRRLTKEELYRFDGTPLFPERCAYTASYSLSTQEADLYQAVTTYVREEMNRADRTGDDKRRMNVGFALQILQRRLASSPAAIHRSLERRRKRMEERLREEKLMRQGGSVPLARPPPLPTYDPDDIDEVPGAEAEAAEEQILDQATAAQTLAELEAEIVILKDLEDRALRLKLSGQDAKWRQLESILDEPIMLDSATGLRRKILIFTEPKDTLEYLQQKIIARLGEPAAVVVVHGGIAREARRAAIAAFNSDPVVRVMVANDAAGEGVNLQRGAHLMVNYDLPWNPNRIEQRFGRIHRIGQTEVCHLWNLCAANTREGEVYRRLLEKLEEARVALGGKVYDVLGELFEGHALRDLLVDAIRYGDRPEKKAELFRKVDGAVDVEAIEKLVAERKLTSEGMDPHAVSAIREQMERAQARRLQPHFIGAFFREAFTMLGGRIAEREKGRFEISRVPPILKERDRLIGRSDPVLDRYARITFEKNLIAGQPQAELVAPGHPLLESMVDVVLERFQPLLVQGGVLVDEADEGTAPRLLVYLEHAIRDGRSGRSGEPRAISQRLQFIFLKEDGTVDGGPAPYLDCRPITAEERALVADAITAPWLSGHVEGRALGYAIQSLVPQHLVEVKARRIVEIDKVEREVRARLTREINYWDARAARLREQERAGQEQRINAQNAEATAARLVERLHKRQAELDRERQISAVPPVLKGAALVIPAGLLKARVPAAPSPEKTSDGLSDDPVARAMIEKLAMDAVMAAERALGNEPRDVSAEKKGYDVESRDPRVGRLRFIEVKGRHADGRDVIVTKNEILASLNAPEAFVLAIVQVDGGFARKPIYVRQFFVFGRVQSPWLPASGDETYEIIRRRLFQALDADGEKAREETVKAFHDLYRKNPAEFPPEAREKRYEELLRLSYPIHPELFDRLSKDWASLEKFQRTRGVLRFMANVIGVLWHSQTRDPLITPGRVPVGHERVRASVLYPLDPAFGSVVDKEVDGDGSLPAQIEASKPTARVSRDRAMRRAARAVFLSTAPLVGSPNVGIAKDRLRLACAEPGNQLSTFVEAIDELSQSATYLYVEAGRYWFSTQPTLNRLADERAKALPDHEVNTAIVKLLTEDSRSKGSFHNVYPAPDDPVAIDEAQGLALVILGPAMPHAGKGAVKSPASDAVYDTLMRCRASQRRFRNTLIFVAADEASLGTAREVMRKAISWDEIAKDKRLGSQLTTSQLTDAGEKAKSNRDAALKAVRTAWSHILYPVKSETAGKPFDLEHDSITARDRAAVPVVVYDKTKADGITLEKLGTERLWLALKPIWPDDRPHLAVSEVAEWFASYVYLPKLRDGVVLQMAIRDTVAKLDPTFGYADSFDEAAGSYRNLIWARTPPDIMPLTAVLVRAAEALNQLKRDAAAAGAPAVPGGANPPVGAPATPSGAVPVT